MSTLCRFHALSRLSESGIRSLVRCPRCLHVDSEASDTWATARVRISLVLVHMMLCCRRPATREDNDTVPSSK